MGAPVPGAPAVALCQARRGKVAAVALCRARGGHLVAGGWSTSDSARTRNSFFLVGESGRWFCDPSEVSSPEPSSSGVSPRPESRDVERAPPVSRSSWWGSVEDRSLPE